MSILEQKIIEEIRKNECITVDRFMEIALFDENYGYYRTKQPIGKEGDFTTAPEISQIFGEIIGLFLVSWVKQNLHTNCRIELIELGAGKGTLMADILRVISRFPEIYNNIDLHIVDVNPELVKIQKKRLEKYDIPKFWYSFLDKIIIKNPALIIANEFFDALPIKQYIFKDKWWERVIRSKDHQLYFDIVETNYQPISKAQNGDIKEVSPATIQITKQIAELLKKQKGLFITFDYGYYPGSFGDSLQSLYQNKYNPVFENIGEADITSHVDFELIEKTFVNHEVDKVFIQTQRDFLLAAGIEKRANSLSKNLPPEKAKEIEISVNRLVDTSQMGVLFKCLIAENI